MAKIHEEVVIIKLSRLVKDNVDGSPTLANPETIAALEQVTQELVGDGTIVEVERA